MSRGLRTKDRIEASAVRLFAERGYDRTSIRDISREAGITDAAIYRHFASKQDLGREVFFRWYGGLARELRARSAAHPDLEGSLIAMTDVFFDHLERDPAVLRFLLQGQHNFLKDVGSGDGNVVDAINDCIRSKSSSPRNTRLFTELITAMVIGIVLQPAVNAMYRRLPHDLEGCRAYIRQAVVLVATMDMMEAEDD